MQFSARKVLRVKLTVIGIALVLALFGIYNFSGRQNAVSAASNGPASAWTNAPGETNCTACHTSFPVNSGDGSVAVSGLPNNYRPNQQIPVTVTVNQNNAVVYGFQATALNSQGALAGSYILPTQNPPPMRIINVSVSGNQRSYIEHTVDGITPTQFNTKSWTFNWKAPAQKVGRVSFYAAGNGADSSGTPSGDYIYTTSASLCSNSPTANFDSDNKADLAVFRPSNGIWYRLNSSNSAYTTFQWGVSGDKLVPGDFDGDGKTEIGVWRSGTFYYVRSSNGAVVQFQWGTTNDIPVVGDFDGDGKTDLAVFRPSNGTWYIVNSADGSVKVVQWGSSGDKPVIGDFDGDGKTDVAVFRPSNGTWYILRSSDSSFQGIQFGTNGDKPVLGDFDGDGKTDIGVYRNGTWYLLRTTAGVLVFNFGIAGDVPIPADYDGDCLTDIAVYRNGVWYIYNSSNNSVRVENFGLSNDIPVPSSYLPE